MAFSEKSKRILQDRLDGDVEPTDPSELLALLKKGAEEATFTKKELKESSFEG